MRNKTVVLIYCLGDFVKKNVGGEKENTINVFLFL